MNGMSIIFPDSICYNVVNRHKPSPLGVDDWVYRITRFEPIQDERTNLHCGKHTKSY